MCSHCFPHWVCGLDSLSSSSSSSLSRACAGDAFIIFRHSEELPCWHFATLSQHSRIWASVSVKQTHVCASLQPEPDRSTGGENPPELLQRSQFVTVLVATAAKKHRCSWFLGCLGFFFYDYFFLISADCTLLLYSHIIKSSLSPAANVEIRRSISSSLLHPISISLDPILEKHQGWKVSIAAFQSTRSHSVSSFILKKEGTKKSIPLLRRRRRRRRLLLLVTIVTLRLFTQCQCVKKAHVFAERRRRRRCCTISPSNLAESHRCSHSNVSM